MAERRTTRRRPRDDDRPRDEDRPQDEELAEEYDDDLPEEADGLAGDDVDADDQAAEDAGQDDGAARRPPTRRKPRRATGNRPAGLTAAEAAQTGLQQIAELTAKPLEGVTQVQPDGDTWTVGVEVVEDRRVPSSADVLGLYEIDIDKGGDVLSYRRLRRYARGRGDDGGGS